MCIYSENRGEVLVAYLYDEIEPAERALFESHLPSCASCTRELAELGAVRLQLAHWAPPEPKGSTRVAAEALGVGRWWHDVPVWARTAAALLVLASAASLAALEVRYDGAGLVIRTGWLSPAGVAGSAGASNATGGAAAASEPAWRAELAALEERLRTEMRTAMAADPVESGSRARQVRADLDDAAVLQRVQALVADSERRQQRELALRIGDVIRDINAQRQADLVRIDRSIGALERNTGVEVMRQGQMLNYLVRTAQAR